jgi:ABC-type sugar transport system ATPase subunit
MPPATGKTLVRMDRITKRFGPVAVLRDVAFEIRAGETHVLAGENGAGKSTLVRILGGVIGDFEGSLEIEGRGVRPRSPLEAARLGVALIHQELSLVGPLSVAENVLMGRTPTRAGFVLGKEQRRRAAFVLARVGLDVDVRRPVEELPLGARQLVEVAKALAGEARVIVMDEPTSALSAPEAARLFALIEGLVARGGGVVYITHRMEEIERIADRVTVLRDGELAGTAPKGALTAAQIVRWMVGRDLGEQFPRHAARAGDERLRVEGFSVFPAGWDRRPTVENVSLRARGGEILGLAGLRGSGASDLLTGLFGGFGRRTRGEVRIDGERVRLASPREAIAAGVGLVTSDRKAKGLVLPLSVVANATLAGLGALSPGGWRRPSREREAAEEALRPFGLRVPSLEQEVATLSGGNQQKVVLARSGLVRPRLLLLDEPTRGIDVGAKREIYDRLDRWTEDGMAILLTTSELPELLALADRVVVMHRGAITAELPRSEATPERVLAAAMGRPEEARA